MSVSITIHEVPQGVHDELADRAARSGETLHGYLRAVLVEAASRPPVQDVVARARARTAATGSRVEAASILADRDVERR